MAHLQREKILPPGGSLFAGPRKLKKSQLMENVPCNIEVVLALNGGAPPKATKPGKRDSVKSQTGKLVQSWLSGNVIETKGSKVNAEELRRRIEESMPEGHNLSKQQLGRILSAIYQQRGVQTEESRQAKGLPWLPHEL
ncbi:uncharacterized protein LOC118403891 [Branchiostoma floridae]|uniref:Uncharacterized protein LOC118403891 n=1 Tax=Branchiostoma floridae TaxID=7739 RepID=A0A9J7HG17_BRAFL|nr:uncharacterized protein LOC118403891 [Branchiostoma floridae]